MTLIPAALAEVWQDNYPQHSPDNDDLTVKIMGAFAKLSEEAQLQTLAQLRLAVRRSPPEIGELYEKLPDPVQEELHSEMRRRVWKNLLAQPEDEE